MPISKPLLPPKKGYVEVEVDGGRAYRKIETEPEPQPTTEERVAALEAENKLLKEQVSAQADQAEFYEDCIAEMATVVYA